MWLNSIISGLAGATIAMAATVVGIFSTGYMEMKRQRAIQETQVTQQLFTYKEGQTWEIAALREMTGRMQYAVFGSKKGIEALSRHQLLCNVEPEKRDIKKCENSTVSMIVELRNELGMEEVSANVLRSSINAKATLERVLKSPSIQLR